ncbi:MAG: SnoaL-like domain-containing protein, partial [Maribacter sp.]|nr:SnoaL-like domain-containing protein [Maribacter sp.]
EMTPEQVVQKQLEFYNQRDINGFMSLIDHNVIFFDYSAGHITMSGATACMEFYSKLFEASPNLHSTILHRIGFGNKVIDHELITGRNGNKDAIELILIYEVNKEKIIRVTVLRKE